MFHLWLTCDQSSLMCVKWVSSNSYGAIGETKRRWLCGVHRGPLRVCQPLQSSVWLLRANENSLRPQEVLVQLCQLCQCGFKMAYQYRPLLCYFIISMHGWSHRPRGLITFNSDRKHIIIKVMGNKANSCNLLKFMCAVICRYPGSSAHLS